MENDLNFRVNGRQPKFQRRPQVKLPQLSQPQLLLSFAQLSPSLSSITVRFYLFCYMLKEVQDFFGPKPWIRLPRSSFIGNANFILQFPPLREHFRVPSSNSPISKPQVPPENPQQPPHTKRSVSNQCTGHEGCHAIQGVCISVLPNQPSVIRAGYIHDLAACTRMNIK